MLGKGDNVDSLDEFRPLESQSVLNISQNDSYTNGNNNNEDELFNGITPLGNNTTSSGNEDLGCPIEWASSFEDDRDGGVSGSIAERRAVTCGFNAGGFSGPTINIARFRSGSPLSSPVTQSPYITIPAGISPTELLDSPIVLRYSQAQSSPTTGTFQPSPLHRESVTLYSIPPVADRERESDIGSSSRSHLENHVSLTPISSMGGKEFELPFEFPRDSVRNSDTVLSADFEDSKIGIDHLACQSYFDGDQQGTSSASGPSKTSEDGYNWRKYGQKQVKGSEFPRSYYKCTHPNCLVKKKVERFYDGEVAEIIYKGTHNHLLPQPNPRTSTGALFSDASGINELCGEEQRGGGVVWRNIQLMGDSENVPSENLDPSSTTQMKHSGGNEVAGSYECSSKLAFQDEDGTPSDGKSLEDDAYLDESESKRRKIELPFPETKVVSRGVREPRVVVQIESDVDILEDGYRWRKYGQKVVKGNPNPRSYYKCTSAGCPVRKHVERACDDKKCVITTYEGKHDHEVPAAKANTVSNLSPATSSNQPAYGLSRINPNAPKAEPGIQELTQPFGKAPNLGNDFMRSSLLGNFGTDMYPLHFPSLQNPMAYGYGGMPNFPMPQLYGVPRPPITMPGSVDLYNVAAPVQSSVVGQQPKENDLGLIKPKQENI